MDYNTISIDELRNHILREINKAEGELRQLKEYMDLSGDRSLRDDMLMLVARIETLKQVLEWLEE